VRLLLADDDVTLCELLREFLELEGFTVEVVHDGQAALKRIKGPQQPWDAIILDVMMPGINGFDILKQTDSDSRAPVLMLTARGEDTDTVLGLELGADDYVAKPVSPRVLVARLRALIRRGAADLTHAMHEVGDLLLNEPAREVRINNQPVDLTGAEFNLLALLVKQAGCVVSRDQLAAQGLGRALTAYDRRIETHMAQIRRKLGKHADGGERIKTVRGAGYQYVVTT